MTIYVSNLSFKVSEEQLNNAFTPFGNVDSAKIILDKLTNRSRGFGFIEMNNDSEAQKAIDSLNGQMLDGRPLNVSMAKPKKTF
jgi:RNA recognition motif-containing protein